jgi:hypothetical protein
LAAGSGRDGVTQATFGVEQDKLCLFAADPSKPVEELLESGAGLEILEERLHGHPGTPEQPDAAYLSGDSFHGRAATPFQHRPILRPSPLCSKLGRLAESDLSVWGRTIRKAKGQLDTREDLHAAIIHGAVKRVRPKLMTVAAAMMGLMPIMWSLGTGSDVMKRVVAPMVGPSRLQAIQPIGALDARRVG